jgi:hypothetical protein
MPALDPEIPSSVPVLRVPARLECTQDEVIGWPEAHPHVHYLDIRPPTVLASALHLAGTKPAWPR